MTFSSASQSTEFLFFLHMTSIYRGSNEAVRTYLSHDVKLPWNGQVRSELYIDDEAVTISVQSSSSKAAMLKGMQRNE